MNLHPLSHMNTEIKYDREKESNVYLCEMDFTIHNYDNTHVLPPNVPIRVIDNDKMIFVKNVRTQRFQDFPPLKQSKKYSSMIASLNGYEIISISENSIRSIMHFVYSHEFVYILQNLSNRRCIQWGKRKNVIYFFCRIKKDNINV